MTPQSNRLELFKRPVCYLLSLFAAVKSETQSGHLVVLWGQLGKLDRKGSAPQKQLASLTAPSPSSLDSKPQPRKHPPVQPQASPAKRTWASHLCMRPPEPLDARTTAGSHWDEHHTLMKLHGFWWLVTGKTWWKHSAHEIIRWCLLFMACWDQHPLGQPLVNLNHRFILQKHSPAGSPGTLPIQPPVASSSRNEL